ncbi:MAG: zinc-ribbon domain-containing protein [Oscillospiraceae bacterium]|nr:zinc-ribbon domain-containing protein [Oscillospiraceae bacterium]
MICKSCGASNPDDALYCSGCGAKLAEQSLPLYGVDAQSPASDLQSPAGGTQPPQAPASSAPESYRPVSAPTFPSYGASENKGAPNPYAGNYTGYTNGTPLTGDSSRDWAGTAAMVCGIISLPCCFTAVGGLVLGICAIVFGILGVKSNKRSMAIVGIVCGAVGVFVSLIMLAAVIYVMKDPTFMDEFMSEYESMQL